MTGQMADRLALLRLRSLLRREIGQRRHAAAHVLEIPHAPELPAQRSSEADGTQGAGDQVQQRRLPEVSYAVGLEGDVEAQQVGADHREEEVAVAHHRCRHLRSAGNGRVGEEIHSWLKKVTAIWPYTVYTTA